MEEEKEEEGGICVGFKLNNMSNPFESLWKYVTI